MSTKSHISISSSSDEEGSEGERGHPLDAVLSKRAAANGAGGSLHPAMNQQSRDGGHGASGQALSSKKRPLEAVDLTASPKLKAPFGARHSKPSQSPESGEVLAGGDDSDDEVDIDAAIPSRSGTSVSDSESGRSSDDSLSSDREGDGSEDAITNATAAPTPLVAPLGVIIVEEGAPPQQNAEMRRLLRMPRYFDPDYEEAGRRCFKCGGKGHLARDCTNPAAKERPCYLCAQLGHEGRDCPNSLCHNCGRPGHMARDCGYGRHKVASWEQEAGPPVCLRCGREDCPCAGQRDYVRAEGGCTSDYYRSDLQHVRCPDCGRRGHLGCSPAPAQAPKLSCYNCGEGGHTAEECWKQTPNLVSRERAGGGGVRQGPMHRGAGSSGYLGGGYSSGSSRGGQQYGSYAQQQQQYGAYPRQYSSGGSRYGGQQQQPFGGGGQNPRFASYHFAAEAAGQGRQSSGGGGRAQQREVHEYSYDYDDYGGSYGRAQQYGRRR
ncbi:hypothetical protein N2152v2_010890 [Parachlorella kessleri]